VLGSQWEINRTMAQVHSLLLVASKPLSTDDIMEALSISRGNANMNIRELIDWGLLKKLLCLVTGKNNFSQKRIFGK